MGHIGMALGRPCEGVSHISQSTGNLTQGSVSESIDGQRPYQLLRAEGIEREKNKKALLLFLAPTNYKTPITIEW